MPNFFGDAPMASTASTPPPPSPVQRKRRHQATADLSNVEVIALSPDTITGRNQFICELCNKGFNRDQNLELHRRVHNLPWDITKKQRENNSSERKKEKVFVCPVSTCARNNPHKPLGDMGSLKKHYCRKHCVKNLKCAKCNKFYAIEADLKAHLKICGGDKYKCDCGSSFSRGSSLRTHQTICNVSTHHSTQTPPAQNTFPINKTTSRNLLGLSNFGFSGFHHPNSTPALRAATIFPGDSSMHAPPNTIGNCGTTMRLDQFDQRSLGSIFSTSSVGGNLPCSTNNSSEQFTSSNLHFGSSMHVDGINASFPYTSSVHAPTSGHKNAMPALNNNIPSTGHYSNLLNSKDQFDYMKFSSANGTNNIFNNLLDNSTKSTVSESEVNIFDINYLYDKFFDAPNQKMSQEAPQQGFVSGNSNVSNFVTGNFESSTYCNSKALSVDTNNFIGLVNSNFNCAATEPQQFFICADLNTLGNFGNSTPVDPGVDNSYFPVFGSAEGSCEPKTNYLGFYGNAINSNVVNHKHQLGGEAAGFGNGYFNREEPQLDWNNNIVGGEDFQPLQIYFGACGNGINGEVNITKQHHFGGNGEF